LFFWNGIEPEDTSAGESLECLYSVISFLSPFFSLLSLDTLSPFSLFP
jgi:hypothetical protein